MKSASTIKRKPAVNNPRPSNETPCLSILQINRTMPKKPRLYPTQLNRTGHGMAAGVALGFSERNLNHGA